MPTVVDSVRLEYHEGPLAPVPTPRLSWVTVSDVSGWRQTGAELSWNSGAASHNAPVDGDASVLVEWPFEPLTAHQRGSLRVRVQGPDGWSEWSEEQPVVATFLAEGEWTAEFVGLASPTRQAQPVLLRSEFDVADGLERATLFATAHGVYQAYVNAAAVDDQLLKPGWTTYQSRLIHETTDVTSLLAAGRNALAVELAGGWYTERFGFQGRAEPFYGGQPSFAGQLLLEYADGTNAWIVSGPDWQAYSDGPFVESGIYLGERYDARKRPSDWSATGFAADGWEPAAVLPAGPVPEARTSPVVRVTQVVPVAEVITSPSGATILDFGQNLVGRLRIRVSGSAGEVVTLRHAEVLDHGELGVRPLRAAEATDTYTLAGTGVEEWAATQTFHGFRYAEISGWPGAFDAADVTAEVVGSDMVRTGWFDCSDPMVSRLHENVVWGMRGNFLYLPTDCPQRDERLGWTGDIQVFSPTASYLFDCAGFLASWLVDLDLEQRAGGGVPFIVPDVLHSSKMPAAAWGDVATILPVNLYERFGDVGVLTAQYSSAKAWVDQILDLAGDRYLWEGGFQFGDWVDPDAPPDQAAKAKTDPDIVASAYLFRSAETFSRHALVLGHTEDAAHYATIAEKVRQAWLAEYVTPAGRILSDAQTSYALAIAFGIATGEVLATMGERLAWLVRRDGYRIGTGFVGTPIIADALSSTGHLRQAGRMLQQTECPSWLYPITMGATTIWERWDSMLEDGSINPGEMTSFNHYALGAVVDWMHRVVAGLAPAEAGYRTLDIAPQFLPGLDWASTRHVTPYGTASVAWRRTGDEVVVNATVPANSTAVVTFPDREPFAVTAGTHQWTVSDAAGVAAAQSITTSTSLAAIMDDPKAYETVMSAFSSVSPELAREFSKRTAWLPREPLIGGFTQITPAVAAKIESGLRELNASRGV